MLKGKKSAQNHTLLSENIRKILQLLGLHTQNSYTYNIHAVSPCI